MAWPKGKPRDPANRGGRVAGTPNKATRAVKEFLAELCDDPEIQAAIKERILSGDTMGFFKALDKMMPDPVKKVELDVNAEWVRVLPAGDDVGSGD